MVQSEFVETFLVKKLIRKSHSHERRFHRQTRFVGNTDLEKPLARVAFALSNSRFWTK